MVSTAGANASWVRLASLRFVDAVWRGRSASGWLDTDDAENDVSAIWPSQGHVVAWPHDPDVQLPERGVRAALVAQRPVRFEPLQRALPVLAIRPEPAYLAAGGRNVDLALPGQRDDEVEPLGDIALRKTRAARQQCHDAKHTRSNGNPDAEFHHPVARDAEEFRGGNGVARHDQEQPQ